MLSLIFLNQIKLFHTVNQQGDTDSFDFQAPFTPVKLTEQVWSFQLQW